MAFSVTPLLIHSDSVPPVARRALLAADAAPVEERRGHLERAARILHRQVGIECGDARELVGLPSGDGCC